MSERIVVVGFGPVAARFIELIDPLLASGAAHLTVIGAEPDSAYNRVLVADVGVGRTSPETISLSDTARLAALGADVLLDRTVRRIDRARRQLQLSDGTVRAYDRLVLATGARPVIPYLAGLNPDPLHPALPPGVTALRDLADARALRAVVQRRGDVVILGGGILGLEAALAAAEEGARVSVVHHGDYPLARNIDDDGGRVLAATLRRQGVRLVSGAKAVGLEHTATGEFTALRLDDGRFVSGDLLVLSCGVRPRTELADGAGLPIRSGILVDHSLTVHHDEFIHAIGDCAEVSCLDPDCADCAGDTTPSGLIGPGWKQAEWLADFLGRQLAPSDVAAVEASGTPFGATSGAGGSSSSYREAALPPVVMLKARGLDAVVAGDVSANLWSGHDDGTAVALWADPQHGRYAKIVTRDGVLSGLVCIGMPRTGAELVLLFESGSVLPEDRSSLLPLDGAEEQASSSPNRDPSATVCRCAGVSRGSIEQAAVVGCSTVVEVSASTRAGTGCGGCHADIRGIIEEHFQTAPA
ncbi:assimilatory nitrate reductase electron transfer subunit [Arthrobacter pigmenti]|uniref:Assimilatory nitrate reductase electron transfer subunit n=1 Tax=Arthrobacter pigmenti TaxID=271432 RepID=A0A846RF65_9MICC|nr:FAD-dependent oxidoreductase [Arthrobacter pigmenti]NJC21798.1 assimilatory nitrate reductase electron transfer subunit [Arthrobacter pigmenti]